MAFSDSVENTIKMCRYCYMCRHACPTFLATKLDSHTPRGYAISLSLINEGLMGWDGDGIERLFHCSQCGLCKELCEFKWPEDRMILEGRQEMVNKGMEPDKVKRAVEKLETTGVLFNGLIDTSKYDKHGADVLLIAGSALYNKHDRTIRDASEILDNLNIDWTMMREEDISGSVLHELGYKDKAEIWAKDIVNKIKELSPKRVVTICPHTYLMLEGILKENNYSIVHMVELLADMNEQNKLDIRADKEVERVMYHDPCNLGRKKGIYTAPRALLNSLGYKVDEFFHCNNEAECCGAGASVYITYPGISGMVAQKRIEQALSKDVKKVVTACPNCKKSFDDVCQQKGYSLEVVDIVSIVRSHIK